MHQFDENSSKVYYNIGEVAKMFNVNTSLLRFWEKEFPQLKPFKNTKKTRYYTKEDIQLIENIYFLVKEKGYTIAGAKQKLTADKKIVERNSQICNSLQDIKHFLLQLKQQLD